MDTTTPTQLRQDLYNILDRILESGEPVVIVRKGRRLRIVAEPPADLASALVRRPEFIVGDGEALVHMDWSKEWTPEL